jgi:hypothetical protein
VSEVPEKILGRVRALLAKAEATEFPKEAEALTERASELMASYGIARAALSITDPESDKPGDQIITVEEPYARDNASFLGLIMMAMRGDAVLATRRVGGPRPLEHRVHLFGYVSDIERAEMLFTSLLVQMAHGLAVFEPEVPWHVDNPAAYRRKTRRAWVLGFQHTTLGRIKKHEARARQDAVSESSGMELVLVSRTEVAQRLKQEAYPKTRKGRSRRYSSAAGYRAGMAAGEKADIGITKLGRNDRALPGGAR